MVGTTVGGLKITGLGGQDRLGRGTVWCARCVKCRRLNLVLEDDPKPCWNLQYHRRPRRR